MKTILLVEDDPNLADGLMMNLEAEGYEAVHVDHGGLVIERFKRGSFDLILMDIMLPGIDGLTLCKEIRKQGIRVSITALKHTVPGLVDAIIAYYQSRK